MKRRLLNFLAALSLAAFVATAWLWAASPWGFDQYDQRSFTAGTAHYFLGSRSGGVRLMRQRIISRSGSTWFNADSDRLGCWHVIAGGGTIGAARFGPAEPTRLVAGFGSDGREYSKTFEGYVPNSTILPDGRNVPTYDASSFVLEYRVWAVPYWPFLCAFGLLPLVRIPAWLLGARAWLRRRESSAGPGATEPQENTAAAPARAIACLRCGYDLSAHPAASANCPECGLPVALSFTPGDELWHAPPGWLAALAWGARLVAGVLGLNLVAGFVSRRAPIDVAMPVAFAAGVWMLTLPQSRFGPPGWRRTLRALALAPLVQITLNYASNRGGASWPSALSPRGLVALAVTACVIPAPALLFLHLRHLAIRLRLPRLADHCGVVGVGASASVVGVVLLERVRLPAAVELLAGVTALLFYAWSMNLLIRFAIAFRAARRQSAAAWRTAEGAAPCPPNVSGGSPGCGAPNA